MILSVWPDNDKYKPWLEDAMNVFRLAGVQLLMCHTYFYIDMTALDMSNLTPVPAQIHDDDARCPIRQTRRYDFRGFFPEEIAERFRTDSWYNMRDWILQNPTGNATDGAVVLQRGCRPQDCPEMKSIATAYKMLFPFYSRYMANVAPPTLCPCGCGMSSFRDMLVNVIENMAKHATEFWHLIKYE